LDIVVTACFTADLLVCLFANSANRFYGFYTDPAKWFDLCIVVVSIISVYLDIRGIKTLPFKVIRIIRVLKVSSTPTVMHAHCTRCVLRACVLMTSLQP
jgi:hypothetical protein